MLAELSWDDLPAGPLSGVQAWLWRTRKGTVVHGGPNCPSLSRSAPIPTEHHLGDGQRLGDLNWPPTLHCDLDVGEDAAQYLRDARRIVTDRAAAIAALAALPSGDHSFVAHSGRSQAWRWWAFGPVLAAAALTAPESQRQLHPDLAALEDATTTALTCAADSLARRLAPSPGVSEREDALAGFHRACAAVAVFNQYDSRNPGPLWVAFRQAGWHAAEVVIRAADPDAEQHRGARIVTAMNALHAGRPYDAPDYLAEIDRDVLTPLESALLHHGRESFTHHRAWTLTHYPDKGWAEVLQGWLDGDSFGWAADRSDRNALARLTVLDAALPALAAADAAWHALLDGLALAGQQPYLLAQPAHGRLSPYGDWMLAASLLAHPARLTPDAAHRRGWLIQCVPNIVAAALAKHEAVALPLTEPAQPTDLVAVAAALDELPPHPSATEIRRAMTAALTRH